MRLGRLICSAEVASTGRTLTTLRCDAGVLMRMVMQLADSCADPAFATVE